MNEESSVNSTSEMPVEFDEISDISNDGSSDDHTSDDIEDIMMFSYLAANRRSLISRRPCRTSSLTGKRFMFEILNGHPTVCHQMFRMQKHVFLNFCDVLKEKGLLRNGKKVDVEEGVAMFLMIMGHTTRYSVIGDRFQHSNHTISKWFRKVLRAVCSLGMEIIQPKNQDTIHERLLRKYPHFKNCIGAVDGTHVSAWAPSSKQTSFRGRKNAVTQNVMVACDFDMRFIFVYAGWEGTANDSRVFIDAVSKPSNNFPMPRGEQFYLVDSGYPNIPGFLSPYRGQRYHLRDYSGHGRLRGKEDLFNYRHSSCRNIIERCIGVLKARFPILKLMTNFPLYRQRQIPIACCTIHNFIRKEHALDTLFAEYSSENMIFQSTPESSHEQEVVQFNVSQTTQMGQVRDQIATQMWNEYVTTRH